jgi:hypothetical protein
LTEIIDIQCFGNARPRKLAEILHAGAFAPQKRDALGILAVTGTPHDLLDVVDGIGIGVEPIAPPADVCHRILNSRLGSRVAENAQQKRQPKDNIAFHNNLS